VKAPEGRLKIARRFSAMKVVWAKLEVAPVDAEQTEIARSAWRKYGKGRHATGLNFGDCFAYASAKFSAQKLLAEGEDFRFTDIELV
jgi:ribonuclease VapC